MRQELAGNVDAIGYQLRPQPIAFRQEADEQDAHVSLLNARAA